MPDTTAPLISTVVLNHNRGDLLRRMLTSYRATITVPYELFIVDSASSDDSPAIIREYCRTDSHARALLLDENLGGPAYNLALAQARGAFLQMSANDLEYLPGWCEYALRCFEAFPKLGQLCLMGPVPTDEEAWEVKPCVLRHSRGMVLYESLDNTSNSSVFRRDVWDRGVRMCNHSETGVARMPNDGKFTADLQALGYMAAWSDHYHLRNLGHSVAEFANRPDYYRTNYESKPWLRAKGWQERIGRWKNTPVPQRRSLLWPGEQISPLLTRPAAPGEPAQFPPPRVWSMLDAATPELESLEFLYALVRLIKPTLATQTGTWRGHSAEAVALALKHNGFGHLTAWEADPELAGLTRERISHAGLAAQAHVAAADEAKPAAGLVGFLLLDAWAQGGRAHLLDHAASLLPGAIVAIRGAGQPPPASEDLAALGLRPGITLMTPQGLLVTQYRPPV